jgi:hypothetical protein
MSSSFSLPYSKIQLGKIESFIIDEFPHSLCCSYNTNLRYYYNNDKSYVSIPTDMDNWLRDHIGKDNYIFGFEDYGQHGEWMLRTRSKEDLLAFTLRWETA